MDAWVQRVLDWDNTNFGGSYTGWSYGTLNLMQLRSQNGHIETFTVILQHGQMIE